MTTPAPRRLSPHLTPATVLRSRELRRNATEAERILWRGLQAAVPDARFRRQPPLGPYYPDFASHRCRLVIELDGGQHTETIEYDAARTRFLNAQGYQVLRFWNSDVMTNLQGVLTQIAAALPSPLAGEGAPKGRMGGAVASDRAALRAAPPTPTLPRKGGGS